MPLIQPMTKLIEYYILFLTEIQVSQTDDLSAMRGFLKSIDHNISSCRYYSLAICYKSTVLVSCHQKYDGISFFQVFKQTYSGKIISVVLMYRKYAESVSLFHEKLQTLNAKEEVDIILEDFNLNAQDPQVLQDISSVLSNFQLLSHNCTHLNSSHIDQVFVAKSFLQTNIVSNVLISTYFSDHDAVCVNFQHL